MYGMYVAAVLRRVYTERADKTDSTDDTLPRQGPAFTLSPVSSHKVEDGSRVFRLDHHNEMPRMVSQGTWLLKSVQKGHVCVI